MFKRNIPTLECCSMTKGEEGPRERCWTYCGHFNLQFSLFMGFKRWMTSTHLPVYVSFFSVLSESWAPVSASVRSSEASPFGDKVRCSLTQKKQEFQCVSSVQRALFWRPNQPRGGQNKWFALTLNTPKGARELMEVCMLCFLSTVMQSRSDTLHFFKLIW